MNKKITLLILIISPWIFAQDNSFEVKVDQVIGKNTEFWKAAGSDHLFYHSLKPSGQFLLKRMGEKGWTCPTWPSEYGGGGLSKEENKIHY